MSDRRPGYRDYYPDSRVLYEGLNMKLWWHDDEACDLCGGASLLTTEIDTELDMGRFPVPDSFACADCLRKVADKLDALKERDRKDGKRS